MPLQSDFCFERVYKVWRGQKKQRMLKLNHKWLKGLNKLLVSELVLNQVIPALIFVFIFFPSNVTFSIKLYKINITLKVEKVFK